MVFDCTARYKGTSLNDQPLSGPDLTNSLLGVLLRFRQEPVSLSSDIKAMFHPVLVDPNVGLAMTYLSLLSTPFGLLINFGLLIKTILETLTMK